MLVKIHAPVAQIKAERLASCIIHPTFGRHIDHVVLELIRQLPVGGFNIEYFAKLPGKCVGFLHQISAAAAIFLQAESGIGKLLR